MNSSVGGQRAVSTTASSTAGEPATARERERERAPEGLDAGPASLPRAYCMRGPRAIT